MTVVNPRHFIRLGLGDVIRRFAITARALRHYESCGLVEAGRDRLNCRVYDATAVERIGLIAALRRAGVSLPQVTEVLGVDEPGRRTEQALATLNAREQALRDELDRLQDVREALRAVRPRRRGEAAI